MIVAVALFVLGLGAYFAHWILTRTADRLARRTHAPERTAFDASRLRPRIQTVRTDFAAQSSLKSMNSPYHEELIESARAAISKMAFFRSRSQSLHGVPAESERS
jgi:hypothetical protein